jgi:hypothetical protein
MFMARKKDKQAQKDKKALKTKSLQGVAEPKEAGDAPSQEPQPEKG